MSKGITLLPHNEVAYDKLITTLEKEQMVAINHATGTGKSFILLKYLYENRDKRILFLAPTYPIIHQLMNTHTKELGIDMSEFFKFDTMIYKNILTVDEKEIAENYDIIVLDEYHRCGAPKWGIKINMILDELKKNKNAKVIGTTATEIRYLDNEKNMNNILFDGVCASTLPLSDAILNGILPAPVYVNVPLDYLSEIEEIERKIKKDIFYKKNLEEYLKEINATKQKIDKLFNIDVINSSLKMETGKVLVFSNQISSIYSDKKFINQILKGANIHEYIIHSDYSREKNEQTLEEFRKADKNDGVHILYSINILNEGVHVKDIDRIFMLRKTTSPIIYFQQLGRLLSYSGRNKQLYVFDFVNNIKRNPVIYELYRDINKRAKELLLENPEKKELYENILNRFKIVDISSDVSKSIDEIKKALSKELIINCKLNEAICVLEKSKEEINIAQELEAYSHIFKYQKYITLEMYDKIKELDINKPEIFDLTREEFIELLGKYENIHQKEHDKTTIIFNKVIEFANLYKRLPSIFSKEIEEEQLSYLLAQMLYKNNENIPTELLNIISNSKKDEILKIYYGIYSFSEIDENKLYKVIDLLMQHDKGISPFIFSYLRRFNSKEAINYTQKVKKYNKENKKIYDTGFSAEKEQKSKTDNQILDTLIMKKYFEIVLNEEMIKLEKSSSTKEIIDKLYLELREFVETKFRFPTFNSSYTSTKHQEMEKNLFCRKAIYNNQLQEYGYMKELENLLLEKQMDEQASKKKIILDKVIEFMDNNYGMLPSASNKNSDTLRLSREFSKIKNDLTPDELSILDQKREEKKEERKAILDEYLLFVSINKREPLAVTPIIEEQELLEKYDKIKKDLTPDEKNSINELFKKIGKVNMLSNQYLEIQRIEAEKMRIKREKAKEKELRR